MAKKNVSPIVSGAGLLTAVWTSLVCAVRKLGGTDEDIHRLSTPDGEVLIEQMARIIVGVREISLTRIELSIVVSENETFDALAAAGHYDWKNGWVTEKQFPVRPTPAGERKLVILHFGRNISSEDAIAEAAKQGLERPTYEDCLRFGAQHPELQRQFLLVFLHEPVRDVDGIPGVLCLRSGGGRYLGYRWFGRGWDGDCRFVFVCK